MAGPENSHVEPINPIEQKSGEKPNALTRPLDPAKGDYVDGMKSYMATVLDKSSMCLAKVPSLSGYAPGELERELAPKKFEPATYAPGELEKELSGEKPSNGIVPVDANNPD